MRTVRKTEKKDFDTVMRIYERAVSFMRESGNPHQWRHGYPKEVTILADIEGGASYVIEENGEILAVFSYIEGEDPAYRKIEEGAWRTSGSYGTVHRLASAQSAGGLGETCFLWCAKRAKEHGCGSLRADTHQDNRIMQYLLEKCGFLYCGLIYVEDGSPRLAYERVCKQ